jgi:hypothetical protein
MEMNGKVEYGYKAEYIARNQQTATEMNTISANLLLSSTWYKNTKCWSAALPKNSLFLNLNPTRNPFLCYITPM